MIVPIIYVHGRKSELRPGTALVFVWNDWDDFGYNTIFSVELHQNNRRTMLGGFRLYIEGHRSTHAFLEKRKVERIDEFLPKLPDLYIGLGTGIEFYQQLAGALPLRDCIDTLLLLHDAALLTQFRPQNDSLSLAQSEAFKVSHLRMGDALLAYEQAGALFAESPYRPSKRAFSFEIQYKAEVSRDPIHMTFDFEKSPLPSSVNVLIGNNGTGKTITLHALIRALSPYPEHLSPPPSSAVTRAKVDPKPPISQVVVVAFSPFEIFPRGYLSDDLVAAREKDSQSYAYCGFRDRDDNIVEPDSIWRASYERWRSLVSQDSRFRQSRGRASKSEAVVAALNQAFDFDQIVVRQAPRSTEILFDSLSGVRFDLAAQKGKGHALTFRLNGKDLYLSAGQRAFVALTLAVVDYIREGALILLEEPELHLHPTLEIRFARLLLELLRRFHASAIIATHSLVLAREVPASNLHILKRDGDAIVAVHPIFETFGADLTKLGNYIFEDAFTDPPHEIWLRQQLQRLGSVKNVLDHFGPSLNLESTLYLRSVEQRAKNR